MCCVCARILSYAVFSQGSKLRALRVPYRLLVITPSSSSICHCRFLVHCSSFFVSARIRPRSSRRHWHLRYAARAALQRRYPRRERLQRLPAAAAGWKKGIATWHCLLRWHGRGHHQYRRLTTTPSASAHPPSSFVVFRRLRRPVLLH